MKNGSFKHRFSLVVSGLILLFTLSILSSAQAQFYPYYAPYYAPYANAFFGSSPFSYYSLFCSPFSPLQLPLTPFTAYQRTAQIPVTTTVASLLPAPTLPIVPLATAGGVGVSSLIPTVPVIVTLPANLLITSPLSALIAYTPFSLVGLTYAPVPVSTPVAPVPII